MFHGVDHDNRMDDWFGETITCSVAAVRKNAENAIPGSEQGITFIRLRRKEKPNG